MEENKEFIEYQNKLLKRYSKKQSKIRNSWGSKYIYRSTPKDNPLRLVKEDTFLAIVRNIHRSLAEELAIGTPICLPYLGAFYIVKRSCSIYIKDGKIRNYRTVDWKATHELWFKDKEAEKQKLTIKCKSADYGITWSRGAFTNALSFRFRACRDLKAKLRDNIRNDVDILAYNK